MEKDENINKDDLIDNEETIQEIVQNSILSSTKKNIGISPDFEGFDTDLISCINTSLNILTQLGVGPEEGFEIKSKDETWDQYIGKNKRLNMVKNYISIKTKLMFDPPTISAVLASYKEMAFELECRLSYEVDPGDGEEVTEDDSSIV